MDRRYYIRPRAAQTVDIAEKLPAAQLFEKFFRRPKGAARRIVGDSPDKSTPVVGVIAFAIPLKSKCKTRVAAPAPISAPLARIATENGAYVFLRTVKPLQTRAQSSTPRRQVNQLASNPTPIKKFSSGETPLPFRQPPPSAHEFAAIGIPIRIASTAFGGPAIPFGEGPSGFLIRSELYCMNFQLRVPLLQSVFPET